MPAMPQQIRRGDKGKESEEVNVIVACEFSGAVREAFRALGHSAWSCDLLPAEGVGHHIIGDALSVLDRKPSSPRRKYTFSAPDNQVPQIGKWDLMIAHPPCTHLAVSGARWFKDKRKEQEEALEFVRRLMAAPIPRICIENPVSVISSRIRKPDQIIQPWMFGDYATKATCLWLKGLPKLVPTYRTAEECRIALGLPRGTKPSDRIHKMPPGPNRAKERSRTFHGIAAAFAEQWGKE